MTAWLAPVAGRYGKAAAREMPDTQGAKKNGANAADLSGFHEARLTGLPGWTQLPSQDKGKLADYEVRMVWRCLKPTIFSCCSSHSFRDMVFRLSQKVTMVT